MLTIINYSLVSFFVDDVWMIRYLREHIILCAYYIAISHVNEVKALCARNSWFLASGRGAERGRKWLIELQKELEGWVRHDHDLAH